jgi:hypothetical protein
MMVPWSTHHGSKQIDPMAEGMVLETFCFRFSKRL